MTSGNRFGRASDSFKTLNSAKIWRARRDSNLSRLAGVSEAGACWQNPERSRGIRGESGAPGEIRTPDLQLRRLPLYPAELRARCSSLHRSPAFALTAPTPNLRQPKEKPRFAAGLILTVIVAYCGFCVPLEEPLCCCDDPPCCCWRAFCSSANFCSCSGVSTARILGDAVSRI